MRFSIPLQGLLAVLISLLLPTAGFGKNVSPFDYGFAEARNGEERYNVLYRAHTEAINKGVDVDYTGIKRVDLEIPSSAKSIPLTCNTDFKQAVFYVENRQKDLFLFTMSGNARRIQVDKRELVRNRHEIKELKGKDALLSVYDDNLWVEKRTGYDYGASRRDIIVIRNGVMCNSPIMPYDNSSSVPICSYYTLNTKKKSFKNISFFRLAGSTFKTFFLKIEGQYNVWISNVSISTPEESPLYSDAAIKVVNSAKICCRDITINGTYSSEKKYGYGIELDNVYDISFRGLIAQGKWGVFGSKNVQKAYLNDCDINRFDIHCYGRDVLCKKTIFRNLYNQFSSVYGTVKYKNCLFVDSIPVLLEYSYNAYTGFDLEFEQCRFEVSEKPGWNCIVSVGYLDSIENYRPELNEKCWPNVLINRMEVIIPNSVKEIYLMKLKKPVTLEKPIGYATSFKLNKITVVGNNSPALIISNYNIPIENTIKVTQKRAQRSSIIIRDNLSVKK